MSKQPESDREIREGWRQRPKQQPERDSDRQIRLFAIIFFISMTGLGLLLFGICMIGIWRLIGHLG